MGELTQQERLITIIVPVIGSILLAVFSWANYEWSLRSCLVDFKHFPVKWQRRVAGLIGIIFIVPMVVILLIRIDWSAINFVILFAQFLTSGLYGIIMCLICGKINQEGTLLEHLHDVGANNRSDPLETQKKIEDFYKKKYSLKRIKKYLAIMTDQDNETMVRSVWSYTGQLKNKSSKNKKK